MAYVIAASSNTQTKPVSTEIMVASAVLITEKYPLNAHAHGISACLPSDKYFIPAGKGIPRKKPVTPIKTIEIKIFSGRETAIVYDSISDNKIVWNSSNIAINNGIRNSTFFVIRNEPE